MELLKLAVLSILRNRRRTLPVLLAVIVAVASVHVAYGYIAASYSGLQFATIHGGTGHLQIGAPEQFAGFAETSLDHGMSPVVQKKVLAALAKHADVRLTLPQAAVQGLISTGDHTYGFSGVGVADRWETTILRTLAPVVEGRGMNAALDVERRTLVGRTLGARLGAGPGDYVTLLTATEDGGINAIDVDVVGLVETGVPQTNSLYVAIPLRTAQALMRTDRISKFVVFLYDDAAAPETAAALQAQLPEGVVVRRWDEVEFIYRQIVGLYNTQFGVFGAIVALVIFLTTTSAVMASVMERSRQIGVLRAIGLPTRMIRSIFTAEAAVLALLGAVVGLALSAGVSAAVEAAAIELPPPPGRNVGVPLRFEWSGWAALATLASALAVAEIAAYVACRRIIRLRIIDAVREL